MQSLEVSGAVVVIRRQRVNISIIRSLPLFCWITTLAVLFLVRCVLEFLCGWVGVVSVLQAKASTCNTNTTPYLTCSYYYSSGTTKPKPKESSRRAAMLLFCNLEEFNPNKPNARYSSSVSFDVNFRIYVKGNTITHFNLIVSTFRDWFRQIAMRR